MNITKIYGVCVLSGTEKELSVKKHIFMTAPERDKFLQDLCNSFERTHELIMRWPEFALFQAPLSSVQTEIKPFNAYAEVRAEPPTLVLRTELQSEALSFHFPLQNLMQ